jgi:hypothetical protein
VAAPVGHIVCALALLNGGADLGDRNAFLAGVNFPDIRYISKVSRPITHYVEREDLAYVFEAPSAFEAGRRFHVFVDHEREKHMHEFNAYRFIKNATLKTQMLKIIEDQILFSKLKGKFDASQVFNKIYDEERSYSVRDKDITIWHNLLITYLDPSYWFNFVRYYKTFGEFRKAYGLPQRFFGNIWQSIKTLGFFIYVYFQVEQLSRNQALKAIVLDFYENKIEKIIEIYLLNNRQRTVYQRAHDPPRSPLHIIDFS